MTTAAPTDPERHRFRISFVCSGNICRSPMADVIFRDIAARAGYADALEVSSAGTGDWHVGEPADLRAVAALRRAGYDGASHRARQFDPDRFGQLDLVIALDRSHERILKSWAPTDADRAKLHLLLSFSPQASGSLDVPDPYYSDDAMFDTVLAMIERASRALFAQLEPALRQGMP